MTAPEHFFSLLVERRDRDDRICVVTADMGPASRATAFAERYPEDFYDVGIAEQDMVCFAAGLSVRSRTVFVADASILLLGRPWEQVRNVVSRGGYNVKLVGTGSGLTNSAYSRGLCMVEEFALLASMPRIHVLSCATRADMVWSLDRLLDEQGPAYVRLPRLEPIGDLRGGSGELAVAIEGSGKVVMLTTGFLLGECIAACVQVDSDVRLINVVSIQPLPTKAMLSHLRGASVVVVVEDHVVHGGLGSRVARLMAQQRLGASFVHLAIESFDSCVGALEDNLDAFGLNAAAIAMAIREA
jgi:transketolase